MESRAPVRSLRNDNHAYFDDSVGAFARLSTTAAIEFKLAIQTFMWASLCLTIAAALLLFTSVFFRWPIVFGANPYDPTTGDKKVWDLEEQVNLLQAAWETVPEYGPAKNNEVLERATKLGPELLDVSDKELGPSGHVIKREYSCYSFLIAAATESFPERKAKFAEKAIELCKGASDDLQYLFKDNSHNKNIAYVSAKDLPKSWASDRTAYIRSSVSLASADAADTAITKLRGAFQEVVQNKGSQVDFNGILDAIGKMAGYANDVKTAISGSK